MLYSGDQTFLKQINRSALLRLVRQRPHLSRAEIAKHTGLTKSTVGLLVAELIAEGWLSEGRSVASVVGRPSTPLSLNDDQLVILGAELGGDNTNVLAVTPSGRILERRYVHRDRAEHDYAPADLIAALAGDLAAVLETQRRAGRRVVGLGLGAGGPVERGTDLLTVAPHWGWRDVPLRELFAPHLARLGLAGLPFLIANEADAGALGERLFGERPGDGPLLYLSVGIGLGGGVVIGDQPLGGRAGFAGEVGHVTLDVQGPACPCGNVGCAEVLIGLQALAARLGRPHVNVDEVLAALRLGDPHAAGAVEASGRWLGVLIANLVNIFNPSAVVVGGPLAELGAALLDPARAEAERRALGRSFAYTDITLCTSGRDACALGAAGAVMQDVFSLALPTRLAGD